MNVHKTFNFEDGKKLEIIQDNFCIDSPRDWDNLGTMVCFHKRGKYGDNHDYKADEFNGWDELENQIREDHPNCIILPIYMYEHSGVTINTTGFSCPWDSGRLGLIFISREKINEEFNKSRTDKQIEEYLQNEVAVYDQFLTGDVWGFRMLDSRGEEKDACWGFYGDDPIENGMVDHLDEKYRKELVTSV